MGLQLTFQVRVQLHCLQVQHTVTDNLLRLGLQKEVFGKDFFTACVCSVDGEHLKNIYKMPWPTQSCGCRL